MTKKILKGTGKKTKGYMEKDPNVRKGIAMGLKSMKKKGFIGIKRKKIRWRCIGLILPLKKI